MLQMNNKIPLCLFLQTPDYSRWINSQGWTIINLHAGYYNEGWDRVKFACHIFIFVIWETGIGFITIILGMFYLFFI